MNAREVAEQLVLYAFLAIAGSFLMFIAAALMIMSLPFLAVYRYVQGLPPDEDEDS